MIILLPRNSEEIIHIAFNSNPQSPGVTLNADEKVEIAIQLSRLGVDVCEAGFPMASQGDFDAIMRIAKEVGSLVQGRTTGKPMVSYILMLINLGIEQDPL